MSKPSQYAFMTREGKRKGGDTHPTQPRYLRLPLLRSRTGGRLPGGAGAQEPLEPVTRHVLIEHLHITITIQRGLWAQRLPGLPLPLITLLLFRRIRMRVVRRWAFERVRHVRRPGGEGGEHALIDARAKFSFDSVPTASSRALCLCESNKRAFQRHECTDMAPSSSSSALWLIAYFTLNLLLTLYNKLVLIHFPFPYALTALHALCGSLGSFALLQVRGVVPNPTSREWVVLVLFSFLYTLNIISSNASLRLVTVPFHQCVRASAPIFVIALSSLLSHILPTHTSLIRRGRFGASVIGDISLHVLCQRARHGGGRLWNANILRVSSIGSPRLPGLSFRSRIVAVVACNLLGND
ncbi:hypothetical protein NMY22_g20226 [Coprinellus aureogranulatus]|nr:hypothetical protein NMY22_g20226 [Coprinellus aureogranulatus]